MRDDDKNIEEKELIKSLQNTIVSLTKTYESNIAELIKQNEEHIKQNEELLKQNSELNAKITELLNKITDLQARLNSLLNDKFKPSSEKKKKEEVDTNNRESRGERKKSVRTKTNNSTLTLPPDTPAVDIYEKASNTICPECGSSLIQKGENITYSLAKRSYYIVVRRHRPILVCPNCDEGTVSQTSSNILDSTISDPSLLASLLISRFDSALPLYRQENELISRQLISSWFMTVGEKLTDNLIPMMEEELNSYALLNVDETGTKVIMTDDGKGKNSRRNAFMVVRAATDRKGEKGPIVFTYTEKRTGEVLTSLLEGFTGCVQTDGLQGYNVAKKNINFTKLGCLVHAARGAKKASDGLTQGKAVTLVELYQRMFSKDKELREAFKDGRIDEEEFLKRRKEEVLPLLIEIREFCIEVRDGDKPPSGELKKAIEYYLTRYDELIEFINYSFATPDNSEAERCIRTFVLGRKNALFNYTERGAEVTAAYYSLIESCKRMNIDPELYLVHLFLNAGSVRNGDREGWRALIPGKCNLDDAKEYLNFLSTATPDKERSIPYILRGSRR